MKGEVPVWVSSTMLVIMMLAGTCALITGFNAIGLDIRIYINHPEVQRLDKKKSVSILSIQEQNESVTTATDATVTNIPSFCNFYVSPILRNKIASLLSKLVAHRRHRNTEESTLFP